MHGPNTAHSDNQGNGRDQGGNQVEDGKRQSEDGEGGPRERGARVGQPGTGKH